VGVDFGSSCSASVASIGFAHGLNGSKDHVMGSFLFQGSNDGKKWISLLDVSREKAIVTYCGWNLAQRSDAMRFFRIMMTSPTSSNSRRMCIKNLTLNGSIFLNGEPYLKQNQQPTPTLTIKREQIRPSIVHVRPKSGVASEHTMQISDASLTNLIHTIANMSWLVSSTQGLAATISSYKIHPPKELLSLACTAGLSDIVALVSVSSDKFLQSVFSYIAEMLVDLSVGCKNDHILRLFLFGRSNAAGTPFMKVHKHTRKLCNKLSELISANKFSNLSFTTTIVFQIISPSSSELQRSKNQMEGIADIARKGVPVSKLPPFDVLSLVEFNLRREVHDLFGQIIPETLFQHVESNSESSSFFPKCSVAKSTFTAPPDRIASLEAQLGASMLREKELRSKLQSIKDEPASGIYQPLKTQSEMNYDANAGRADSLHDAQVRNLQIELQEAAKREEALRKAPYFGTNPADAFDVGQLKQQIQELSKKLAQKDEIIAKMTEESNRHQEVTQKEAADSTPLESHSQDHVIQRMQTTIDDLLGQISTFKNISAEKDKVSTIPSKSVNLVDSNSDESFKVRLASVQENLQKQVDINQSLVTAAVSRDKQVHDLEMQVARLQAKLQESYDEVDHLMSEQELSQSNDRLAELESELEQAALREENLQQLMLSWSSEDDRRRIRDLERNLILSQRKEEELRNAPPPPIPSEIIDKIRTLEDNLQKSDESAQSLKRKLEMAILEAKERSDKWASTEAELRSACLQWTPEVDRKRILELQKLIQIANDREDALNYLLQQKPTIGPEEKTQMESMKFSLQEQQFKVAQLEEKLLAAPAPERLLAAESRVEDLHNQIRSSEQREENLMQNIQKLEIDVSDKKIELLKSIETLEQHVNMAKSREEYLMFEISQLKERLPENRDEVIEGLKLMKADSIEKTRSQKAEIRELQKVKVDLELQTRLNLEAEEKIRSLQQKSKEQRKLLDAEKAANLGLHSQITELQLTIQQNAEQASLQGLPPKAKDLKVETIMLNSKRTIVGLDKERRAVHEKEKETAKRNQELKTQASKAQEKMQRAVESEEQMQIRMQLLSEVTSNEAKVASTIVDSLSVATEQRILELESERDACKLQEIAALDQLEEMSQKVAEFEKTKQAAQESESALAIKVIELQKLVNQSHSANFHPDLSQDSEKLETVDISYDAQVILQTTVVQEYLKSSVAKAKIELREVLEKEFVETLAEVEHRKGDAVHTAFIKADATVVKRIQNFVDEKSEMMKHMTYLARAHADSNMAAKLAEEKLTKLEPNTLKQHFVPAVSSVKSKSNNIIASLPPIKMGDVGSLDSFPRRLLSVGTSPLPGARSTNSGGGVGFVSEEAQENVAISPYAQISYEPGIEEVHQGTKDPNLISTSIETKNMEIEEQLISEKKKISKLTASLKVLQEEKVALQVELATQRHLTDVCQQELDFLRKQTKKGFLPRFLDRSPTRQERVEKSLEIQDDLEDDFRRRDFRPSRSASGPVQFVIDRGSSQKFAGVSVNTMKKLSDDDLQRIKAYSPNLFKSDKKKPLKQMDASEEFKSEFNFPKSKFEQLADQWMFDEPSIKKRQEQIMLQEHLQSLKNKAMKQQAILFAVASKQGVKVPQ
jgi:hypothetical protein